MKRGDFLKSLAVLSMGTMTQLRTWVDSVKELSEEDQWMPALFIGHGNPMNAIADNAYTRKLKETGKTLPKPKAILVISAHWLSKGTWVSSAAKPEMIYDMYGFPPELYKVNYPSPGSPDFAKETHGMLSPFSAKLDESRGIDHGVWSVLVHLFPEADIPVYTLSIDWGRPLTEFYEIGKLLTQLRKKGVMIIGSGNVVHNLGNFTWDENAKPFDWAVEFDGFVKKSLESGDHQALLQYRNSLGKLSQIAHPTDDHYLPLMYLIGTQRKEDSLSMIYEDILNGSIAMRCVKFG